MIKYTNLIANPVQRMRVCAVKKNLQNCANLHQEREMKLHDASGAEVIFYSYSIGSISLLAKSRIFLQIRISPFPFSHRTVSALFDFQSNLCPKKFLNH
jgi:hypothetical protein